MDSLRHLLANPLRLLTTLIGLVRTHCPNCVAGIRAVATDATTQAGHGYVSQAGPTEAYQRLFLEPFTREDKGNGDISTVDFIWWSDCCTCQFKRRPS